MRTETAAVYSVTFRFKGCSLGKFIVTVTTDGMFLNRGAAIRSAIASAFQLPPDLSTAVARDLATRSLRMVGHFRALNAKYPFSIDPATGIEACVLNIDPTCL